MVEIKNTFDENNSVSHCTVIWRTWILLGLMGYNSISGRYSGLDAIENPRHPGRGGVTWRERPCARTAIALKRGRMPNAKALHSHLRVQMIPCTFKVFLTSGYKKLRRAAEKNVCLYGVGLKGELELKFNSKSLGCILLKHTGCITVKRLRKRMEPSRKTTENALLWNNRGFIQDGGQWVRYWSFYKY